MPLTSANSLDEHVPHFDGVHLWIVTAVQELKTQVQLATARAKLFNILLKCVVSFKI